MQYRILGRTGIKVSAIGIGGEGFENKSYEACEEIIDCAMKEDTNQILTVTAYVTASNKEKDYSEVLANAPRRGS